MARGYYKLPEKTAESFFEEHGIRWFRTGDIGEMCANGNLRIVGQSRSPLATGIGTAGYARLYLHL